MKVTKAQLKQIIKEEVSRLTEPREYKVSPNEPLVTVYEDGRFEVVLVTGGRVGAMTVAKVKGKLDPEDLEMLGGLQKQAPTAERRAQARESVAPRTESWS